LRELEEMDKELREEIESLKDDSSLFESEGSFAKDEEKNEQYDSVVEDLEEVETN